MNWGELNYFKRNGTDNWGDPDKMSFELLKKLDSLRGFLGEPIHVTSGYRYRSNSTHGAGLACDIICPSISLVDFWIAAERYNFNGLGIYPHWHWESIVVGGLHVDVRNISTHGARWLCYLGDGGVQVYTELSKKTLSQYGVI